MGATCTCQPPMGPSRPPPYPLVLQALTSPDREAGILHPPDATPDHIQYTHRPCPRKGATGVGPGRRL